MREKAWLPIFYLGAGTVLFALGPAVLKLMTTMAGRFGVSNPGAISFCNVLFVGNFCAGLMTFAAFGGSRLVHEYLSLPRRTKSVLWTAALVSTIYPALIFTALERTTVVKVVILSRFNGIVFVVLSYFVFRSAVRVSEAVGYSIIAAGVLVLVFTGDHQGRLGGGEVLVLVSTLFFALTELVSRKALAVCSIELYVFFRNFVSAVIFFVIATYLFGLEHFAEAFSAELWVLMVLYAGAAVVAAQFFWLKATQVLPVRTVANSQLLNPIFSIFFAFLLLEEIPTPRQWAVMAVVLVGMMAPLVAALWRHQSRDVLHFSTSMAGTH